MVGLVDEKQSLLVTIDIQEKLIPTIYQNEYLLEQNKKILQAAQLLNIPKILTEHFPHKLGPTAPEIKSYFTDHEIIEKTDMSCCENQDFSSKIKNMHKEHIILTGIEAHVCVLQTAIQLHEMNKKVYVVSDAISARAPNSTSIAIERMRHHGIEIINFEMLLFEWIRCGDHPQFKPLIQLIK